MFLIIFSEWLEGTVDDLEKISFFEFTKEEIFSRPRILIYELSSMNEEYFWSKYFQTFFN